MKEIYSKKITGSSRTYF